MTNYFLIINFLFLIILNKSKLGLCNICDGDFYLPKKSEPVKEVNLEVGQPLIIYCKLWHVTHECNSRHLVFTDPNGQNFANFTRVLNDSTIELQIENMAELSAIYYCQYRNNALDEKYGLKELAIRVGYKPEILKFSCLSINQFEKILTCTIEQRSNNPFQIDYTILFGASDDTNKAPVLSISTFSKEHDKIVTFDIKPFKIVYPYYYMNISMVNSVGSYSNEYWIDVPRSILPIIQNVSVTSITPKSAVLIWTVVHSLGLLNLPYDHQIEICQQNSCTNINTTNIKPIDGVKTKFHLKIDLEYAYTWYNVKILTSVRNATYEKDWSYAKGTVFQTTKCKPDSPPTVAVGAFEILSNDESKIYWKEMPSMFWNAHYLTYEIIDVISNGNTINVVPEYNENNTTAKFHRLRHNDQDYQFKIISKNSEGRSTAHSVISIPRNKNYGKIEFFFVELKKKLSNSVYTLSWEPQLSHFKPDNYTIFWCYPIDEQGTLCDELLDFVYVDSNAGNKFTYNNTLDKKTKIFAIASNSGMKTSGMHWFPCSRSDNKDMTNFQADLVAMGATKLNISWNVGLCPTSRLTGFNISYCPFYNHTDCNETKLYIEFEPNKSYYIMENLFAYTTYLVKISMFDGSKSGPIVEKLQVTDSCQPSTPYELEYTKITNNAIKLKWEAPQNWNGQPQFYNISYKLINNTSDQYHRYHKIVEKLNNDTLPPNTFELDNLRSYSDYIIEIAACNPACSNFSAGIKIKTKIGKPDPVPIVEKLTKPGLETYYEWQPPAYKAGRLDFYEFLFEAKIDGKNSVTRKIQLKSTRCTPVRNFCNKDTIEQYRISVRAVNIIPFDGDFYNTGSDSDNSSYNILDTIKCSEEQDDLKIECGTKYNCSAGDWREGVMSECNYASDKVSLIYIVIFCIGLGVLIGVTLVCKKVQQIKNVGIPELPEGMEGIMAPNPKSTLNNPHKPQNGILDEQKTRLINGETKSIHGSYMDNVQFDDDLCNSNSLYGPTGFTSIDRMNILNVSKMASSNLKFTYGYDQESNPIINSENGNINSNEFDYDVQSVNNCETMSNGSSPSMYDNNRHSILTETTNTESNYVTQSPSYQPQPNSPSLKMTSNGYVRPCDLMNYNSETTESNYISQPLSRPPLNTPSNGYVRPCDLIMKPTVTTSGYVSIGDLPNQNIINTNPKFIKHGIVLPENGYVKPKHLVGFGPPERGMTH